MIMTAVGPAGQPGAPPGRPAWTCPRRAGSPRPPRAGRTPSRRGSPRSPAAPARGLGHAHRAALPGCVSQAASSQAVSSQALAVPRLAPHGSVASWSVGTYSGGGPPCVQGCPPGGELRRRLEVQRERRVGQRRRRPRGRCRARDQPPSHAVLQLKRHPRPAVQLWPTSMITAFGRAGPATAARFAGTAVTSSVVSSEIHGRSLACLPDSSTAAPARRGRRRPRTPGRSSGTRP